MSEDNESKAQDQVRGGKEDEDGELVAEDGKEITPAVQEIYDFDEEKKEENQNKEYKKRRSNKPEERKEQAPSIMDETLQVPKVCEYCYLQDKCNYFQEDAECYFRQDVNIESPQDMIELLKKMIEMQGERVLFGRFIEQTEGGYMDKNLSEEMSRLMELMKDLKQLSTEQDEISIKVSGKNAVESANQSGVLSQIFGGGGKEEEEE